MNLNVDDFKDFESWREQIGCDPEYQSWIKSVVTELLEEELILQDISALKVMSFEEYFADGLTPKEAVSTVFRQLVIGPKI